MPLHSLLLPPIPEDTARRAAASLGSEHLYRRLGLQANQILSDLPKAAGRLAVSDGLYALLTAIQYVEGIGDQQVLAALRSRVDLQYALHLSPNYPSFDPQRLCIFRQKLFVDSHSMDWFQALLDRLAALGLRKMQAEGAASPAAQVLEAVCTRGRLEIVVSTVYLVLGALAVTDCEWLRRITRPHWYERFNQSAWPSGQLESVEHCQSLAGSIGQDIRYLLEEIESSRNPALISLEDVALLEYLREEQFETVMHPTTNRTTLQFKTDGCSSCIRRTGKYKYLKTPVGYYL